MILIDTHIWLWWAFIPEKLSAAQHKAIKSHREGEIGVCSISCWEVAMLDRLGRFDLGVPVGQWLEDALCFPGVRWLPMTPEIAVSAVQLPEPFHKDPADRIITATAIAQECPLLTADKKLIKSSLVETIK